MKKPKRKKCALDFLNLIDGHGQLSPSNIGMWIAVAMAIRIMFLPADKLLEGSTALAAVLPLVLNYARKRHFEHAAAKEDPNAHDTDAGAISD